MTDPASPPIIVGAGVAGLAAGIALARAGTPTRVLDKAAEASPAGGGIQLGPNAVKVLYALGLQDELDAIAARPEQLRLHHLPSGSLLGRLTLGSRLRARYGAPYCTLLRADLSGALVRAHTRLGLQVQWGAAVARVDAQASGVRVELSKGQEHHSPALIGADGLWSVARSAVPEARPPLAAGQTAVRAVVSAVHAPQDWRSSVLVFSAPQRHVVSYPVRAGQEIALVVIMPSRESLSPGWGAPIERDALLEALGPVNPDLQALMGAASPWLAWPLWAATPMASERAQAFGRVALIGDAAHPMRPHLAQGAAMGLEDALVLANAWARHAGSQDPQRAFEAFARLRWRRNALIQSRAIRTGRIFQLSGALAWARNLALGLFSETLMDQPQIYAYDAAAAQ